MGEMAITFRINDQIVTLHEPIDGSDHLFNITNDDVYTADYLIKLINNGFISLAEPLISIARIDDDGTENFVYPITSALNEELMSDQSNEANLVNSIENPQSEPQLNKEICTWIDAETRMLLDLYEQYLARVGPMKQFKTKKTMWSKIAEDINSKFNTSKSPLQCENRFKTVLKRKKIAVENNNRSGNSREQIPFEEELSKIASVDDSIQPEVTGTAGGIKVLKTKTNQTLIDTSSDERASSMELTRKTEMESLIASSPSTSNGSISSSSSSISTPKRKRGMTVQETLMEIFERKEAARERRHQEKLELLRNIFDNNNNNRSDNT